MDKFFLPLFQERRGSNTSEKCKKERVNGSGCEPYSDTRERGDKVVQLAEHAAVRKLINLNRYEFNFIRAPLLIAYEFFNPEWEIDEATRVEREILKSLSQQSEKVFSVSKTNPTHYAETLVQEL